MHNFFFNFSVTANESSVIESNINVPILNVTESCVNVNDSETTLSNVTVSHSNDISIPENNTSVIASQCKKITSYFAPTKNKI